VNLLAANLTTQVRAIAEVATAVTKGDLTRSIQVDARGELAELKDNINTMIGNLRLTTDRNTEQDWLKTNLAKFTNMLQGQRDLLTVGRLLLSELTPLVNAQLGVIYQMDNQEEPFLRLLAAYADDGIDGHPRLAGDSAGGGLVVAALVAIRDAGLAQPSCGWCISPWVDMEAIGGTMTSNASRDPTVQKEGILEIAGLYMGTADPRSPLASPIYADLRGIAPLYIQVGAVETLLDDATRLASVAGAADVPVTLEVWPEMPHVWHLFHPQLAAGRRAITAGARYVRAAMEGRSV
jgi:HAMP domain-containing protein